MLSTRNSRTDTGNVTTAFHTSKSKKKIAVEDQEVAQVINDEVIIFGTNKTLDK